VIITTVVVCDAVKSTCQLIEKDKFDQTATESVNEFNPKWKVETETIVSIVPTDNISVIEAKVEVDL